MNSPNSKRKNVPKQSIYYNLWLWLISFPRSWMSVMTCCDVDRIKNKWIVTLLFLYLNTYNNHQYCSNPLIIGVSELFKPNRKSLWHMPLLVTFGNTLCVDYMHWSTVYNNWCVRAAFVSMSNVKQCHFIAYFSRIVTNTKANNIDKTKKNKKKAKRK